MSIIKSKYDANFNAGGILHHEFISLKQILLSDDFVSLIKEEEANNQFMAVATLSARKRIIQEIRRRYKNAPVGFWNKFFDWNEQEQKLALFFLCLKTYPLIFDFHLEIALKKFNIGSDLDAYDITMRFDEIASVDEFVASWSEQTEKKLNSRYRNSLKNIGLYDGVKLRKPENIRAQFSAYFEQSNEVWFLESCFLKH